MAENKLTLELEAFQGPFDLLLHLIKEMEVDINDIPMTAITQQYIAYIHQMQELELDIVGDYLVMAATLLEIKSRLLLPIEPVADIDAQYEGEDPRHNLVQQLLLYQEFQTVSLSLKELEGGRSGLLTRPPMDLSDYQEVIPLQEGELNLSDLTVAMQRALEKVASRQPKVRNIHPDSISVEEKMDDILKLLETRPQASLTFIDCLNKPSRSEIIASFMAILELVRKQSLSFVQKNLNGPIQIKARK